MEEKKKALEEISASVTRYYDSLTDEEAAEDRAWGEFAAAQLAGEECSDEWQGNPGDVIREQSTEHGRLPISRLLPKG
jgi:hypothetical protein